MLSCAIDAKENRYLAETEIPGAFLHANLDEEVYMLLHRMIEELIIKSETKLYRKYLQKYKTANQCCRLS